MKNILITGAGRGLGNEIAKDFSSRFSIINFGRTACGIQNAKDYFCDLSDLGSIDSAVSNLYKDKVRVDCVIVNAGITSDKPFLLEDFDAGVEVLKVNALHQIYLINKLFRKISRSDDASVIMISSSCVNFADRGLFYYSLSKSILNSAMELLAAEFAPFGVRVNCVSPSFVEGSMFEKNSDQYVELIKSRTHNFKLISPSEIIAAIDFVFENKSVNAKNILLDNGSI